MGFTIKQPVTSNKPPAPTPLPDPAIFLPMKTLRSPWGDRDVWVSHPQPDRLIFTAPVSKHIYKAGVGGTEHAVMLKLKDYLLTEPFNCSVRGKNVWKDQWKYVALGMGDREAYVRFEYLKATQDLGPRFKIECNPRKLQPQGFYKLLQVLAHSACPIDPAKMISIAKVNRLDIAVDVVGLSVSEIAAWHKEQGKRSMYVGDDGQLETVQLHRKLKPLKPGKNLDTTPKKLTHRKSPAGTVILKIYDRVRERATLLKPPPFGPAPVTRLEIVSKKFGTKGLKLTDLHLLIDRFKLIRAGYVLRQATLSHGHWRRYAAFRRTLSSSDALEMSGLAATMSTHANAFKDAEKVPYADVLKPGETWKGWPEGMLQTGLTLFIDAATSP